MGNQKRLRSAAAPRSGDASRPQMLQIRDHSRLNRLRTGILALTLCSALLSPGCEDTCSNPTGQVPDDSVPIGSTVTLKLGQSALFTPDSVTLGLIAITQDCRCPLNVYCFWPGIAEAEMWFRKPEQGAVLVHSAIIGSAPAQSEMDYVAADTLGYRVALIDLTPYPIHPGTIDQSEYVAHVRVTRLGSIGPPRNTVVISDMAPDSIQVDPFHLVEAAVSGDRMDATVQYSGGWCRPHYFWLHMSPASFMESILPQANLYLRHHSSGDMCEALITERLSFSIRPIAVLYDSTYGGLDSIQLNLYEYFETEPDWAISTIYSPD